MRTAVLAPALVLAACGDPTPAELTGRGERWADADALFHQEPRWLGGDGAYSIDLGDDRSLWLFGDSFVATSAARVRTESTMVRNSIAVMTGRDPLTATMQFAWRDGTPPHSYFPEDGDHWFWPVHGVRVPGGALVVFLAEQRATPGQGLGFAHAGWRAVRIADPSGPPSTWTVEPAQTIAAPYATDATVGVCTAIDEDHLVAVAVDGSAHHGRLARWPLTAIASGDLASPEWWTGSAWVAQAALTDTPANVLPDGATECSLTSHAGHWVHVASRGFGASTIAIRTAPSIEGPYSDATDVFTPPESSGDRPFVYAGKAHPQLTPGTGHDLVVTYADNSFTFADLFDPAKAATLYWPHVARIAFD